MKLVFSFHGLRFLRESDGLTLRWVPSTSPAPRLASCLDRLGVSCCHSYYKFLGRANSHQQTSKLMTELCSVVK